MRVNNRSNNDMVLHLISVSEVWSFRVIGAEKIDVFIIVTAQHLSDSKFGLRVFFFGKVIELYYNLLAIPAEHCAGNVGFERVTVPQICGTVPVYLGQKKQWEYNYIHVIRLGTTWPPPLASSPRYLRSKTLINWSLEAKELEMPVKGTDIWPARGAE